MVNFWYPDPDRVVILNGGGTDLDSRGLCVRIATRAIRTRVPRFWAFERSEGGSERRESDNSHETTRLCFLARLPTRPIQRVMRNLRFWEFRQGYSLGKSGFGNDGSGFGNDTAPRINIHPIWE